MDLALMSPSQRREFELQRQATLRCAQCRSETHSDRTHRPPLYIAVGYLLFAIIIKRSSSL